MILLIDPAHEPVAIALANNGNIVAERTVSERRQQSAELLSLIDQVLTGAQLDVGALEAVAVVRGPGSFTSLRVGLAAANALAQSARLPMIGLLAEDGMTTAELARVATTQLAAGQTDPTLLPEYGRPPSITPPAERSA